MEYPFGFTVLALFLLCLLSLVLLTKHTTKKKKKYHPIGGTVIHHLLNFKRLHHYMTNLAAEHRTYRLLGLFRTEVYTSDPVNVEFILKTNFHNYAKGDHNYNNLRDLLGDGIFTVDGDKWRQQRKISSYEFSTKVLRDFSSVVFRNNDLFMKSTLDSIFKVAFGVELDSMCGSNEEGTKFSNAFDDASAMTLWRYVDPFWKVKKLFNIGSEAALNRNVKIIDDFVYKLINNKIELMRTASSSTDDCSTKKDDILSRFLQVKETEDPTYLRDIILNFVIAGKDTTAATLSWFIYMMCKHPDVQDKVCEEIMEATERKEFNGFREFAESISEDALEKMQYVHAAITETLRLYPAVPVDAKVCVSDDTLPDGYSVKKGDMVAYQPYAMGRMKFIWGDDSLALFLLCLLSLTLLTSNKYTTKKKKFHPIGGTVIHQLVNFNRLWHYMTDLAAEHRTYRLLGPFRTEVYTSDPVNVEFILKTQFHNYAKGDHNYNILSGLLGDGIFAVDGDKWRQQRKISSYEFSTKVLRNFSTVVFRKNVVKLADIVSQTAQSGQSMDIQDLFMKSTLDSIFKVAFGVELDSMCGSNEEGTKFSKAFDDASSLTLWRYVDPFWKVKKLFNIGSEAALNKTVKIVDDFVYKLINNKIELMRTVSSTDDLKKDDILSRFLQVNETQQDPTYLRDIILNFVIAGKDTTAATLSWFVYMMCKHPDVQDKVCEEIMEATERKEFDGFREFAESINGYNVKKGDMVAYQPYAMGRMKFIWGDDCEQYKPERWLNQDGIFQPQSPFKFTAFQAGPRICLGKEFAYRQMKIFAAVLIRSFVFKLSDETKDVSYRTMLTLHVDGGLHVAAAHRSSC
ncbi:Cytochrome P450 704C1 [Linum grandiflorum]